MKRRHRTFPVFAAVLAFGSAGCAAGAPESGFVLRDSAGVMIAENTAPLWSDARIVVDAEPYVTIGSASGNPGQELYRVSDALRLRDGRVLVLNSGTSEIRFFSATGEHLRTIGGEGSGPGEFRGFDWASEHGDSILVYDPFQDNGRTSWLTSQGDFISSSRVAVDGISYPSPDAILPDGSFLSEQWEGSIASGEVGFVRYTRATIRYSADGNTVDTIAITPGSERFREAFRDGISQWSIPFARDGQTASYDNHIYLGNGETFTVEVYDLNGTHVRSIRIAEPPSPVTDEMAEHWVAETLRNQLYQSNPQLLTRWTERYAKTPAAATMPAFDKLIADAHGRLWVRRYAPPWEPGGTWTVFDQKGRWLGEVQLPAGLDVLEIGSNYILGTRTDSMDIEYVQLHRMHVKQG